MSTISFIKPSIIDSMEISILINDWKNKSNYMIKENLLKYKKYNDWIQTFSNKKEQLKIYNNIFDIFLIKTIENNLIIGLCLIKKNTNIINNPLDVNINFFILNEYSNDIVVNQIINLSLNHAKDIFNLDEVSIITTNLKKHDQYINNYKLIFKKEINEDGLIYKKFLVKLINL